MEKSIILLNFLNRFFRQKRIIKPNNLILLAISGGQDSSFLFFLLLHFQNQWNLKFHLLWCNHLWQNESFYTMEHIFKLANFFQIPIYFVITEITVFSEQTARKWRLNTFQRIGFYSHATSIFNGHTASDRIEGALFNLLRGSGSEGLQSFDYQKNFKINKWKNFFLKSCKTKFKINVKSIKNKKMTFINFTKRINFWSSPTLTRPTLILKWSSIFSSKIYQDCQNQDVDNDSFRLPELASPNTNHYQKSFNLISIKLQNKKKFFFEKKVSFFSKNSVPFCKKKKIFSSILQKMPYLDSSYFQKKNIFSKRKRLRLKNYLFYSKIITNGAIGSIKKNFKQRKMFKYKKAKVGFENLYLNTQNQQNYINFQKILFLRTYNWQSRTKNLFEIGAVLRMPEEPMPQRIKLQNLRQIFQYHTFYTFFFKSQINTNFFIIRPLGTIQRFDVQQICGLWKIPLYPDQSNRAFCFMRNRIRNQILPTFRFFFNPQIDRLLYQFVEIQMKEQIYFSYLIERLVTNLEFKNKHYYILNINFFENLPLCLQRRVLRFFFKDFMSFHLKFSHIEILLNAIHKNEKISLNWDSNFLTNIHYLKKTENFLSKNFKKSLLTKKNFLSDFISQTPIYLFFPKTGFSFLNLFLKVFY